MSEKIKEKVIKEGKVDVKGDNKYNASISYQIIKKEDN